MTKDEMIAYGIAPEKVKEFSRQYHDDIAKQITFAVEAEKDNRTAAQLRAAILGLLPTIKKVGSLRRILRAVNTCYYIEDSDRKAAEERKAAQEPVTVDDLIIEEAQEEKEDAQ